MGTLHMHKQCILDVPFCLFGSFQLSEVCLAYVEPQMTSE